MAKQRRAKGDGQVAHDKSRDRWIGRVPEAECYPGLKKTVSAMTEREANRLLGELRKEHAQEWVTKRTPIKTITVADLVEKYAKTDAFLPANAPPRTKSNYRWTRDKIVNTLGDRVVNDIDVEDVDDALQSIYDSGVQAAKSLRRVRAMMRQVFDWGIDRKYCERNPATRASLPSGIKPAREGVAMDPDICVRLLGELEDHPMQAAWVVQFYLGLRSGESAAICIQDIDFDNDVLYVRRNLQYTDSGVPFELAEVKTGNRGRGRRSLRMPPAVRDALRRRLDAREMQVAVYGEAWPAKWKDVVFVTNKGVPPNAKSLSDPFRKAGLAIGINVRRYDARHTAATLLADQGFSLEEIADILGHEDTRMGRTIYTHVQAARIIEGSVDLSPGTQ